ncbi:hypothetical protein [Sphingobacterium bambusae]|uniref:DUF4398 domain-containing protein n=1 Tax=Sphingobacterium bambusae TaxID=662858 RepID=A0ABW6BHF6_9SPHI|nr:hypothetical protein [Sphingobacterium bambusae]WPL49493.1 hypothetical protein SCB77_03390 [Sphingobacterium bambusae]
MKHLIAKSSLFCLLLFPSHSTISTPTFSGCEMTISYAEMAFASYKKAHQAATLEAAAAFLKEGNSQAKEAAAYAVSSSCGCSSAETYALSAFAFGTKALKADDLDKARKLIKKAMNMSLDILTVAPNCKD